MLAPVDQLDGGGKDVLLFAVTQEARSSFNMPAIFDFPWCGFAPSNVGQDAFSIEKIQARRERGDSLTIDISWNGDLRGSVAVKYENTSNQPARHKVDDITGTNSIQIENAISFTTLQLNDIAHEAVRNANRQGTVCKFTVKITNDQTKQNKIFSLDSKGFQEIFPRSQFTAYIIGWIKTQDFVQVSHKLRSGSACYFYPPANRGTKTENTFIHPQNLLTITDFIAKL